MFLMKRLPTNNTNVGGGELNLFEPPSNERLEQVSYLKNLVAISERKEQSTLYGKHQAVGGGTVSYTHLDVYKRQH